MKDPYYQVDRLHDSEEIEADYKSKVIDRLKDDLLTAVINGEYYKGWDYADVLGYIDEAGYAAKVKFLQEAHLGAIMPDTAKAYNKAIERAAEEIVMRFDEVKEL